MLGSTCATGPTITSAAPAAECREPYSLRLQLETIYVTEVLQIEVTQSAPVTATVLTASRSVEFSPSGRNAFPYWKYFIGQWSFRHCATASHRSPAELPTRVTSRVRFAGLGSIIVEKNIPLR